MVTIMHCLRHRAKPGHVTLVYSHDDVGIATLATNVDTPLHYAEPLIASREPRQEKCYNNGPKLCCGRRARYFGQHATL